MADFSELLANVKELGGTPAEIGEVASHLLSDNLGLARETIDRVRSRAIAQDHSRAVEQARATDIGQQIEQAQAETPAPKVESTPDLRAESLRALMGRGDVSLADKRAALDNRWDELDKETAQRRFVERGGIPDPDEREATKAAGLAEYTVARDKFVALKAAGKQSGPEARKLLDQMWNAADRLRRADLTMEDV